MGLSKDIIDQFVAVTNDTQTNQNKVADNIYYGTGKIRNGRKYVMLDGSEILTPVQITAGFEDGDRVSVTIKNHTAMVTGNITSPSIGTQAVVDIGDTLSAYYITAEVAEATYAKITSLETEYLTASQIEGMYVKANKLESEYLTARQIETTYLKVGDVQAGNITVDELAAHFVKTEDLEAEYIKADTIAATYATIERLNTSDAKIDTLESGYANINNLLAGNVGSELLQTMHLTADNAVFDDAIIKSAHIESVSLDKLEAGAISTNVFAIASDDGGMMISGSTQQFRDRLNRIRLQIGRDASNNFSFAVFGEDGRTVVLNQNGITKRAVPDGLIVNDMIADNASIDASKIHFVDTDGGSTLQTLLEAQQGQIQGLVRETTITESDGTTSSIKDAYSDLRIDLDSITTVVNDTTMSVDGLESSMSSITQKANKIDWLVQSGSSSSNFTLTSRVMSLVSENIDLTGKVTFNSLDTEIKNSINNVDRWTTNSTKIDGGYIEANSIDASAINVENLSAFNANIGAWSISSTDGSLYSRTVGSEGSNTLTKTINITTEQFQFINTVRNSSNALIESRYSIIDFYGFTAESNTGKITTVSPAYILFENGDTTASFNLTNSGLEFGGRMIFDNNDGLRVKNTRGASGRIMCLSGSNNIAIGTSDNEAGTENTHIYAGDNVLFYTNRASASYKGTGIRISREQSGSYRTGVYPIDNQSVGGDANAYLGYTSYRWNTLYCYSVKDASDLKLKNVIQEFDFKPKEFIMGLKPIAYSMKNGDSKGNRIHMGFGAQDINKLLKDINYGNMSLVSASIVDKNQNGYGVEYQERYYDGNEDIPDEKLSWDLAYSELIAPMVAMMQSQQKEIDELKQIIKQILNGGE